MLFGSLKLTIQKFKRLIEILWLIAIGLLADWFTRTRFYKMFRRRAKTHEEAQTKATQWRIRALIEDLGPTFIKFGQILADRPDLVSEKLRRELKKLQASARPFDDEEALALIEEELGAPIHVYFSEFDRTCLASASIGQVYTGVLHNGEKVVVKIQRPGIYSKIKIDLILMKILAGRLIKRYPELASMNLIGFVDEFSETLIKELNYQNEATNILRFTQLFRGDPSFVAPKVYTDISTKRLLMMERIEGITPDEVDRLKEEGYDLNEIAKNGCNIMLTMILRHGVFHADPHPGNIFILPGNRICFIDYGMVAVLRPAHIQFIADFTLGFATKNPNKIADALLTLSDKKFFAFEDDLRFEVREVINRYSYIPLNKTDISAVMMDCVALIVKHQLHIPSSIYMLLKAIATIQKFAMRLEPEFSMAEMLVPYAKDVVKMKFSPKRFLSAIADTISDYATLVREFPRDVSELMFKLKQGKLIHEISLREDKQFRKTLRIFSVNIGLAVTTALVLTSSIILYFAGKDPVVARYGFIGGLVLAGWMYIRSLRHSKPG
jgi:ubiquinone biosynthesis protein